MGNQRWLAWWYCWRKGIDGEHVGNLGCWGTSWVCVWRLLLASVQVFSFWIIVCMEMSVRKYILQPFVAYLWSKAAYGRDARGVSSAVQSNFLWSVHKKWAQQNWYHFMKRSHSGKDALILFWVLWAIDLRHLWRREKKYWGYFIKRYIIKHVQVWFLHFGTWPSFLIQNQLVKLFRWSCAPFEAWCLHTMLHCILCFTKATHFIHQESLQVVYVGTRFAVPCPPGCPQL